MTDIHSKFGLEWSGRGGHGSTNAWQRQDFLAHTFTTVHGTFNVTDPARRSFGASPMNAATGLAKLASDFFCHTRVDVGDVAAAREFLRLVHAK